MPRLGLSCVIASLLILAGEKRVHAAELAWRSSSACDHRVRVAQEAERLLGQPLDQVESADFAVTIRDLDARRVELQIQTTPRNPALDPSSRTLVGASCAELVDAAALAIAMTVSGYQERAQPVEEVAPRAPEPPAEPPAGPVEHAPAPEPLRFAMGAAAALDVGAFPKAALGVQVQASLRYRWLKLVPLGVFFPRSSTETKGGAGAEFHSAAGGLLACAEHGYERITLAGCAGYELGKLSGRGTSVELPRAGSSLWSAVRAELQLALPLLPRLLLTSSAGFTVPTARERFELQGGLVHRPSAATGRFGLGLEIRL